jgi:Kef-type K+ transport system membrane component KefB
VGVVVPDVSFENLLIVGAVAFVAPLLLGYAPRLRVPSAVLEAIGYGFLVPVFFVTGGLRLDLRGLVSSPAALARVPVFLLAMLLVRGLAAVPYLRVMRPRAMVAAALLQATSLPLIVTATQIGVATDRMTPVTAAALVCAGLLSVLLFPAAALVMMRGESAGVSAGRPGGTPAGIRSSQ